MSGILSKLLDTMWLVLRKICVLCSLFIHVVYRAPYSRNIYILDAAPAASCRSWSWFPGRLMSDRSFPSLSRGLPVRIIQSRIHKSHAYFCSYTYSKKCDGNVNALAYLLNLSRIIIPAIIKCRDWHFMQIVVHFCLTCKLFHQCSPQLLSNLQLSCHY